MGSTSLGWVTRSDWWRSDLECFHQIFALAMHPKYHVALMMDEWTYGRRSIASQNPDSMTATAIETVSSCILLDTRQVEQKHIILCVLPQRSRSSSHSVACCSYKHSITSNFFCVKNQLSLSILWETYTMTQQKNVLKAKVSSRIYQQLLTLHPTPIKLVLWLVRTST